MCRQILMSILVLFAGFAGADICDAADVPVLNSLSYRLVGPFRGGRVTAVSGVVGDSQTYYMGTTGGGVWKTSDAGISWRNISDLVRELEHSNAPRSSPLDVRWMDNAPK